MLMHVLPHQCDEIELCVHVAFRELTSPRAHRKLFSALRRMLSEQRCGRLCAFRSRSRARVGRKRPCALDLLRRRLWSCEESAVQPIQRSVVRCELPPDALLRKYAAGGAYTDCYATEIAASVDFAEYVEAFYMSAAFKPEQLVLWLIGKPSGDADSRRLARGEAETFAAWSVEGRASGQLLLCDFLSRTRSWLMIAPTDGGVRLYFGSAVVPVGMGAGRGRLGFPFNALLGFHGVYSRVLLGAARARVIRLAARRSAARDRRAR
jgi:hypothetical protein